MKKIFLFIFAPFICPLCFGQILNLPEKTTIVEENVEKADKEALPDFNNILQKPTGSGSIVPELPNVDPSKAPEAITTENKEKEKLVFSEVLVGGGYPFLFYGDCSVFGTNHANPFKFAFNFDSANGYNGTSLTDNFSDRNISLLFEKQFRKDNFRTGFSAEYESISNGFQNQVFSLNSVNQDLVKGNGFVKYNFNNGVFVKVLGDLDFYNRYVPGAKDIHGPDWYRRTSILSFVPKLTAGWAGNGFETCLSGSYLLDYNIFGDISGGNNHIGLFEGDFQWSNDFITAYGNVGFAFGNHFTKNKIAVPFKIGASLNFPVSFANRRFSINGEGGLDYRFNRVGDLESQYKFTALPSFAPDSADWYGKLSFDIPVKSWFTGNASAEYRKTAFEKGVVEPVYSDDYLLNGLYGYKQTNRQLLSTDISLTYHYKFFSVKGGWHSNWLDVPATEFIQKISLNIALQDEKAAWGASLSGFFNVQSTWTIPVVNIDCFVQLTPKVRLIGSIGDFITLFDEKTRDFQGKYVDRGFSSGIFLKFVL